ALNWGDISVEHALNMVPRAGLVALIVQGDANHPIADRQGRVSLVRSESEESPRKLQRGPALRDAHMRSPQAVERTQLVFCVADALCDGKGADPGSGGLRRVALRVEQ